MSAVARIRAAADLDKTFCSPCPPLACVSRSQTTTERETQAGDAGAARTTSMADPTTFPEEHVGEPLVYRRVSGFAIAAVIVAACYAFLVLAACISGLSKG